MRWVIAVVYGTTGLFHLATPEPFLLITPSWLPFARQVILLTGLSELVASVALLFRPSRFWAGVFMAAYAICVWPANFKHAIYGIDVPHIPNGWIYHGPRLLLQPVIVWWALFCAEVVDWPFSRDARRRR